MKYNVIIINFLLCINFISCVKKDQTSQFTNKNIVITTGKNTVVNPATQNSTLQVGGSAPGWWYDGCAMSNNSLTGHLGSTTDVKLTFPVSGIYSGNYLLVPGMPLAGQASLVITNAPGQPTGVKWYSQSGTVSVVTGTSGVVATFSNVPCTQSYFTFPIVTASGILTCN